MASGDPQPNEINEDHESNELYNSFMDITKDAAVMDHGQNNSTEMEEKDEQHSVTVVSVEKGEDAKTVNEQITEKTVEVKNEEEVLVSDEKSHEKRLSKAVNELSDLEQQLSLMITESSKHGTQQDNASGNTCVLGNVNVKDTNKGEKNATNDEGKSQDVEANVVKSSEDTTVCIAGETVVEGHNATEDKASPAKIITIESKGNDVKESSSGENSLEKTGITTKFGEDDTKETSSERKNEDEGTTGDLLKHSSADGVIIIVEDSLHDDTEVGNVPASENPSVNVSCTASHKQGEEENPPVDGSCATSQNQGDQENVIQKDITALQKPDTKVEEGGKQEEVVDGRTEAFMEKSSPEVEDDTDAIKKQSSSPDIEILMTDESGISERKSLDSLDSLDENKPDQPDSPTLSDEGIDSDSKSDVGDDDTFDTSFSDFPMKSTSSHLVVDRNRAGSDSSTLSEQEFKSCLPDKTDGLNGEALDTVSMKGYLLKLGGSGLTPRNWRKRWFILKGDNCLYYYKNSKDKVPCGVIVLCNYSITKAPESSRNYCFKLNKGGARSYHFCANNDDEMREWMVALMAAATEVAPDGSSFQIAEGNVHNVSIPALSIKDPECHGYLSKQGHNIKNWKRRYCVLKNGYLYYYSDMSNTTALGVAKLLGYTIKMGEKRGKHYCFYGSPSDESLRTYHFAAETENDRDRWMTRMTESIRKGQ